MKELVSVIIPFYNEEQYIGDCLIKAFAENKDSIIATSSIEEPLINADLIREIPFMGKIHYSCKQTNRAPTEIGRPHEAVAQNGITAEFMYLADGIVHGFLFPVMLVHFHSSLSLSAVHKFHVRYVQLIYRINTAISSIQPYLSALTFSSSIDTVSCSMYFWYNGDLPLSPPSSSSKSLSQNS